MAWGAGGRAAMQIRSGEGDLHLCRRGGRIWHLGLRGEGDWWAHRRHRAGASSSASGVGGTNLVGGGGLSPATRHRWGGLVAGVGEGGAYYRFKVVKIPAISAP
ncbi:hypothetical protein TIFTF001_006507 [Ficus carica]|uniref:Uncharacterized protein n=1 Tax=Ficus carica TaxID=3494 RepID=A0AA88DFR4_FICCA|nr:hypothetical protein TIFTF001_006507 [Ficus carica]